MFYIFNKNKIISYMVASVIVLFFFAFSTMIIPNDDVKLQKISTNVVITDDKDNNKIEKNEVDNKK